MDLRLRGKRALVTGASSGIGRAIAAALAQEGVDVAINGRKGETLAAAAKAIAEATGARVVPIVADVSRLEEVERLVADAVEALGGLDILVNNVPAPIFGPFLEHSDEEFRSAMDIKFMGYLRASRAAVPHFRSAGGGVIINNIGSGGKSYTRNHMAGGASNAALMLSTTAPATELGPLRIRVIGVNAGAVRTARHDSLVESRAKTELRTPEEIVRETVAAIPTGAITTPEDVADLVVFLASDRARQINGTTITIDGGILKTI